MAQREERDETKGLRPSVRKRGFRLNTAWIAVALVLILSIAQVVGALIHNLNQTRMGAIFAIGVVSFLGMLSMGHWGERHRPVDSAEVRMALTTSFAMVFFAAVAIFLFSTNSVGDFGRSLMDNLTSLFGVVIGFYFASSAVVDYGKARGKAGQDQNPSPTPDTAALEAKVRELEAKLARVLSDQPGQRVPEDGSAVGAKVEP